MSSANQQVDGFTFILLYVLAALFLQIPSGFPLVKLLCFSIIVCGFCLCFIASQNLAFSKPV